MGEILISPIGFFFFRESNVGVKYMNKILDDLKIIVLLIKKDIKESIKNRTALMIIMLPLFASIMFSLIGSQPLVRNFEIGISSSSSAELISFIENNYQNFSVEKYLNSESARKEAAAGNLDALIIVNNSQEDIEAKYEIYLDSRDSVNFFIMRENISSILKDYHGLRDRVNFSFRNASELNISNSILPIWLTVTITMIGLMLISGSLAEEKENYTLAALLVSRVKAVHIITAKIVFALLLTLFTSILMGGLNGVFSLSLQRLLSVLLIITAGSLVFSGFGLLISLVTDSQASARAVSTVLYFPVIFPALISDISPLTEKIASFFPTFYMYQALDKILLYSGSQLEIILELVFLLAFALVFFVLIFIYIRKADSIAE